MGSHTATGEWKSFEYRMRHRRAERVLLRAEVAADAGLWEEARACLEEARALAPSLPGLAAIEHKLEHPEASASGDSLSVRSSSNWGAFRRVALVMTAATVVAVAAGTAMFPVRVPSGEPAIAPAHDFRNLTLAINDAGVRQTAAQTADVSSAPSPAADAERATLDREEPREARAPMTALPELRTVPAPMVPDAPIGRIDPPLPTAVTASLEVEDGLPGASAAGTTVTVPVSATPSPAVNAESSDAAVRRTLDRYADAYSALDAAAAARVWPSVNRGALTRAFDGLASQQISLGTCRVDVHGGAAHADCAGSATWAPKVGASSARTESRRWTFELARRGADWQIVDARVQNR